MNGMEKNETLQHVDQSLKIVVQEIQKVFLAMTCNKCQGSVLLQRILTHEPYLSDETNMEKPAIKLLLRRVSELFASNKDKSYFTNWMHHDDKHSGIQWDRETLQLSQCEAKLFDFKEMVVSIDIFNKEFQGLKMGETRILSDYMVDKIKYLKDIESIESFQQSVQLKNVNVEYLKTFEVIKKGSSSCVYRGELRGVPVAVKTLKVFDSNEDQLHELQFLREARLLSLFNLPGVVRCYGVDNTVSPHLIVMEAAKCSLFDLLYNDIKDFILNLNNRLVLLSECCSVLSFLHGVGLHRNINPSNILIMYDGHIKLTDFGLAQHKTVEDIVDPFEIDVCTTTINDVLLRHRDASLMGTAAYLAPELMIQSDKCSYSEATDMYAFGIMANEVLTQEKSFKEYHFLRFVTKMCESAGELRPSLFTCDHECDYHLQAFIKNCWNTNSLQRWDFMLANQYLCNSILRSTVIQSLVIDARDDCVTSSIVENKVIASARSTGYYTGEMRGGKRHGKGTIPILNGATYNGDWSNDFRHCKGSWADSKGNSYDGNWLLDCHWGSGVFQFADGREYEGEWENNSISGKGKLKYANGELYEGEFRNNLKKGFGVYHYKNGDVYEGSWDSNLKNGYGKMIFASGNVYIGEWKDDKMHNHGKMNYVNGVEYDGPWEKGLRKSFLHSAGSSSYHPIVDYEITKVGFVTYFEKAGSGLIFEIDGKRLYQLDDFAVAQLTKRHTAGGSIPPQFFNESDSMEVLKLCMTQKFYCVVQVTKSMGIPLYCLMYSPVPHYALHAYFNDRTTSEEKDLIVYNTEQLKVKEIFAQLYGKYIVIKNGIVVDGLFNDLYDVPFDIHDKVLLFRVGIVGNKI